MLVTEVKDIYGGGEGGGRGGAHRAFVMVWSTTVVQVHLTLKVSI